MVAGEEHEALDPVDGRRIEAEGRKCVHCPARAARLVVRRPRVVDGVMKPEGELDQVARARVHRGAVEQVQAILEMSATVVGAGRFRPGGEQRVGQGTRIVGRPHPVEQRDESGSQVDHGFRHHRVSGPRVAGLAASRARAPNVQVRGPGRASQRANRS